MQPVKTTLFHSISLPTSGQGELSPGLILLHGRGADENDLLGLKPYVDPRFFILSVRAPFQFPWGGYTWYDIEEVGRPHNNQFSESFDRLRQFVDDVKAHYPVDQKRMYVLGFSMGSVMSFALSLTQPSEVRGVVAHSGYIPETSSLSFQWENLDRTAFFVAHGIHDPVITIDSGRRAHELLSKTSAHVTYREYPIAHQISEESLTDVTRWLSSQLNSAHQN